MGANIYKTIQIQSQIGLPTQGLCCYILNLYSLIFGEFKVYSELFKNHFQSFHKLHEFFENRF